MIRTGEHVSVPVSSEWGRQAAPVPECTLVKLTFIQRV